MDTQAVEALVKEILSLNPSSGELGEGKARNLQDLAKEVEKSLHYNQ